MRNVPCAFENKNWKEAAAHLAGAAALVYNKPNAMKARGIADVVDKVLPEGLGDMLKVSAENQAFFLFGAPAPGSPGIACAQTPTLQPFVAPAGKTRSGASVLVFPGGGYQGLAPHEGEPVARWLNQLGISAFVVRYRVTPNYFPTPLLDGQRAIRLVRQHATAWDLDPGRIGVLGFSAGGHLVSMLATQFDAGNAQAADPLDRPSSRPQVQLLLYPVITQKDVLMQQSFANLLGPEPAAGVAERVCSDLQVTTQTPPAFVFHSTKDSVVPVAHADMYVAALRKHAVGHAFVRGEYGDHGIGLHECWTPAAARFLRQQGF